MSARPPRTTADEHYLLSLERHAAQGWRRVRLALWSLGSAASLGFLGHPSIGEWVVRRRADDVEVLRLEAGGDEESAVLRADLQRQLAELTVAEFDERWGVGGS